MLRPTLLAIGLLATFSGSIMACLFSMSFSGAVERSVTDGAAYLSVVLAIATGFLSAIGEAVDIQMAAWKRILAVLAGASMAIAAAAFAQFAVSYSGTIEGMIVNISAGLGLMFGLGSGFSIGGGLLSIGSTVQLTSSAKRSALVAR